MFSNPTVPKVTIEVEASPKDMDLTNGSAVVFVMLAFEARSLMQLDLGHRPGCCPETKWRG